MKVSIRVFGVADYESEVGFSKFKLRIQYGGQNLKKLSYKRYNLYIWLYGIAAYESEVRFSKYKMADSI